MVESISNKLKNYLNEIEKNDKKGKKINAFLHLNPHAMEEAKRIDAKTKKGKLYGKIIALKSNINCLGMIANCGSKTLENYESTYDASVIRKIKEEDGLIIGMATSTGVLKISLTQPHLTKYPFL